jgi:undecaprenyl-phosphate 4-deoxy-4-formamido-L-arabinose transferase
MTTARECSLASAPPDLSVVVPVYRSEECLHALVSRIEAALGTSGLGFEVVLVNDGSPDCSWQVIERLARNRPHLVGIDLRRNFGQDNAILTGLRVARGRLVVVMDDDLQHDPADIPALVAQLEREDADVAYADFRVKRQAWWKNLGSWLNGKFAEWLIDKPRGLYLSPYKVMRGEVAELICRYDGPDPYVDGLLLQVTSRVTQVPVEHRPRYAGKGNYTFLASLRVWARLATAFSVRPLRLMIWCGFLFALLGGLLALYVVGYRLLRPENFERAVAGWASLMVAHLLTTAVALLFLGVLGEYTGRTYLTACRKPQAAVRQVLNGASEVAGEVPAGAGRGPGGGGP